MRRSKQPIAVKLDARAIGQRIRAARNARGWRIADLAAAIGMAPQTVACYECGARVPLTRTLVVLAVALRRTVDWILTGRHGRNSVESPSVPRVPGASAPSGDPRARACL
jgi:transcriptional regulator with XRE-family HTH domain